jgi:hypothetical protein
MDPALYTPTWQVTAEALRLRAAQALHCSFEYSVGRVPRLQLRPRLCHGSHKRQTTTCPLTK